MSRPPLHAMQGFVAAARSGNLSRAAESLHITVSALSHQVRGLEERLGQPLFLRGARGVTLTAAGRELFEQIAPHMDAIEQAVGPGRVRRDDALTLTLLPSLASSWLVPRLPRFLATHPHLQISLQSKDALVDFQRETGIDAGLRFGRGQWPGVQAVYLFDDWVTPTASPALLDRLGTPTLETLGQFPLLDDTGSRWSQWFERFGGRIPKRFVAAFDHSETLHRAASEGLGIALGRFTLMRPLVDAGLLVPLFEQHLKAEYAHYLVYPPRSQHHVGLAAFRDWLLEEARAYTEELATATRTPPPHAGLHKGPRPSTRTPRSPAPLGSGAEVG